MLPDESNRPELRLSLSGRTANIRGQLLPVIGVAGGVGRTSTAHLLAACLAASEHAVGLLAGDVIDDTDRCAPRERSPRPGDEHRWARRCAAAGGEVGVWAATPAPSRLADDLPTALPLAAACLTSLRGDGLDSAARRRWRSPHEHREAIARTLAGLDRDAWIVAPADDPDALALATSRRGAVMTYGDAPHADVRGELVDQDAGGQTVIVTAGKRSAGLSLGRPGRAYRENCLAALATTLAAGVDFATAVEGLETAPARLAFAESLPAPSGMTVLLDRAAKPIALASAMHTARELAGERVLVALQLARSPRVAATQLAAAERLADRVLAWTEHPSAPPSSEKTTVVEDRTAAVAVALGLAERGDAVLIAGAPAAESQALRRLVAACFAHREEHGRARAA